MTTAYYYCDGPECARHARRCTGIRTVDQIFLRVTGRGWNLHFCSWDCVLRYGATIEPEEVIPA